MAYRATYILFLLTLWMHGPAGAQNQPVQNQPWAGVGLEVNGIAGKVYKHESKFTLPIPSLTTGADVNLMMHTYGRKAWQQRRHYPTIGLGLAYINYGIDSIYGQCVGLYPNITLPLIRGRYVEWTLRLGDGIGYVSRHFSRTTPVDTINVAIGSHINDFAMVMTDIRYRHDLHWEFEAGLNITHISDASYRKPNLGINMTGMHAGIRYFPVTSRPVKLVHAQPDPASRWLVQGRVSMAYVSSYTPGGPLYPVYLASGYVSRRWWGRNKVFAGADYAWYQSIYSWLRNNELYPGHERAHSYKTAVFAGNEFLFGRLGVVFQLGYYLQPSAINPSPFYEKAGGHLYLVQKEHGPLKELFISAFLKAHETVAELGELGVGVGF